VRDHLALLEVNHLVMHFATKEGPVHAVDDVSFSIDKGEIIGLAGESGSGKSSIAISLLGLLPANGQVLSGSVVLDGKNISKMTEAQLSKEIRWKRISLVSQAAMNALNPVFRVGDQISEAIQAHSHLDKETAKAKVRDLLLEVGIPPDRYTSFPHELSGGMKQRSIIAMALALDPDIVIADEPTTALDVIVQAQILVLLRNLQRAKQMAMILITHDLSLVSEMCDKVAIIYAGQVVEYSSASKIYHNPKHPYTIGLLKAFPNIAGKRTRLVSISGSPPDLVHPPEGCRFSPRCPFATSKCRSEMPPLLEIEPGHFSRCWYASDMHL
jgi:oligopeptide/dipeptide ABC transporter ATP-binding protein